MRIDNDGICFSNQKGNMMEACCGALSKRKRTKFLLSFVFWIPLVIAIARYAKQQANEISTQQHLYDKDFASLPTTCNENPVWETLPWTNRTPYSRYRASQYVKNLLKSATLDLEQYANNTKQHDEIVPEAMERVLETLGSCGTEFITLFNPCNSHGSAAKKQQRRKDNRNDVILHTLVYSQSQLEMVPTDWRYRIVDQTRQANLDLSPSWLELSDYLLGIYRYPPIFIRQYSHLTPLRPMFQAQISEVGALMAIADKYNKKQPPMWIGINPIKRCLSPSHLDKLVLKEDSDHDTVFFWTTCCNDDIHTFLPMSIHNYNITDGVDLDELHSKVGRNVFGNDYTIHLPGNTWMFKGGFMMHRDLFFEYACFCRVFLAHFLNHFVSVLKNKLLEEAVRPQLMVKPESSSNGVHSHTKERAWGYFFERLLNYWVYNAGYSLAMIDGGDATDASESQRESLDRHGGKWQVLKALDTTTLTDTQKRLRTCQAFMCTSLAASVSHHQPTTRAEVACPHLYTDSLKKE